MEIFLTLKCESFGVKRFKLSSSKSGYVCSLITYTGKGTLTDKDYILLKIRTKSLIFTSRASQGEKNGRGIFPTFFSSHV